MTDTKPRTRREVSMLLPAKKRHALERKIINSGKSHRQLAAATGWKSHTMLSQLIHGTRNTIDVEAAIRLCLALRCDVYDLFVPVLSREAARIAEAAETGKAA